MARKISPTERAVTWRKERVAEGYKQKAFLLSPAALKALASLKVDGKTERDVVDDLLVRAAKRTR